MMDEKEDGRCGHYCKECYDPDPTAANTNRLAALGGELNQLRYRIADLEDTMDDLANRPPTPINIRVSCDHKCNPGGGLAELCHSAGHSTRWAPDYRQTTYTGTDSSTP